MNPYIFREYDIRGVVNEDFPPADVSLLGQSIGTYLRRHGKKRITIGRDVRLSSTRLRDDIVQGLTRAGICVVDIGICPTPLLYFSIHHLQADGGVMITGSHNPPEFNGFKVCLGTDTIYGEEIQELRRLIEQDDLFHGTGSEEKADVFAAYSSLVRSGFRLKRPLKVVLDAGNGTAGLVAPELIRSLGCSVTCLYCEPDGRFPHHHPDPTIPGNLQDLSQAVRDTGADLGISFDGDADRIGVLDEKGGIIWGDRLLAIFARAVLKEHPGACVVSEVKSSKVLFDDIRRHGGRPVMGQAGHSLMKNRMKQEKALLAGEMSGHIFFADRYLGYDDAVYAACRLLEILAGGDQPLSALLSDLPQTFATPEIRVPCPDEVKFRIVAEAKDHFRKEFEVIDIDGVRIVFEDGWALVRVSNTQPMLVYRFEADTEARLAQLRQLVEGRIAEIRQRLDSGNGV